MSIDHERIPGEDAPLWLSALCGIGGVACAVAASALFVAPAAAAAPPVSPVASSAVLLPAPPPPPERKTCAPLVVPFALASSAIDATARGRLEDIARRALLRPTTTLLVHGHADALGTEDANLALSRTRATAVGNVLVAAGVERGRLTVRGFGAYQPVEGAPEEAASNRRVVVYVLDGSTCVPWEGGLAP